MLTVLFSLLVLSLVIGGFVVVFSKLRQEAPWLDRIVGVLPGSLPRAIRCSFCLGYWIALPVAAVFDPLVTWQPSFSHDSLEATWPALRVLGAWFALGLLATFWRLTYFIAWKKMVIMNQLAGEPHKH